ncbi:MULTISPECIES: hypothetical protein [unclassified Cyanobium]|uniref:hypothetical protein n=1 Tax=unclassified Cyanobium TaxID=2627006 RepID=UPI0020CDEAB6|nr:MULTISPECIES: hypothetical protein [unclassified Cyanobium]MCP9776519.1 hypothetical protein [Cyanobium sp. Tous-M-B4]MCP9876388.1 hypothetical protein [Cyanobium sp. A2C-AMD]
MGKLILSSGGRMLTPARSQQGGTINVTHTGCSSMRFLAKSIPIDDSLTPAAIDIQASQLSRYHLIKDLALKGTEQVTCFLQRVEQIHNRPERLQLNLITILCEDDSSPEQSQILPLFDFIGIHGSTFKAYGVMLSTYLHDLDRKAIDQDRISGRESTTARMARLLVDSLFLPTYYNNNNPPFLDQTPVFIFPESRTLKQGGRSSSTDHYMAQLGFKASHCSLEKEAITLRLFRHESEEHSCESTWACKSTNRAILAVGQACVEMAKGIVPVPGSCLKPFDRAGLNGDVQTSQTAIAERWLIRHQESVSPG